MEHFFSLRVSIILRNRPKDYSDIEKERTKSLDLDIMREYVNDIYQTRVMEQKSFKEIEKEWVAKFFALLIKVSNHFNSLQNRIH